MIAHGTHLSIYICEGVYVRLEIWEEVFILPCRVIHIVSHFEHKVWEIIDVVRFNELS